MGDRICAKNDREMRNSRGPQLHCAGVLVKFDNNIFFAGGGIGYLGLG